MKVFYLLVSALSVWTPTHAQFFYSHYTPLPQFSPIFSQPYYHPLPAVSPLAYTAPPPQSATAPSSITYNIPAAPAAEFRGFGYRTDYKDGASSTVYYVTGPEAENLRNFQDFPGLTRQIEENSVGKARSLASDITDINAIPDANGKIRSILQPAEFQRLFENVVPGVLNFYNFPAGTAPLALARQLNVTDSAANVTTTTPAAEEEAAESIVNPKVVVNSVDNRINLDSTKEEATTVSEAPEVSSTSTNTESTTTTEASENNEEATTSSTEEATTVEATTEK